MDARKFVREYGLQRLKRELIAPGFVSKDGKDASRLTTGTAPFNVFARIGAGKMPGTPCKVPKHPEYEKRFIIARNRPENDKHWESKEPEWLGKSSMGKRHRFMIIRDLQPGEAASPDRMDLNWLWFNALTMGLRDVDPECHGQMDPEEIQKEENIASKNKEALGNALNCLIEMREAAYAWVKEAEKGADGDEYDRGWDLTTWQTGEAPPEGEVNYWRGGDHVDKLRYVGLFFHPYPHGTVNSLHLHIVDLKTTGPTFEHLRHKNLHINFVIEALQSELEELGTVRGHGSRGSTVGSSAGAK